MSTANDSVVENQERTPAKAPPPAEPPAVVGNPILIGVPTFLVGSIALGLVLVGYAAATGASIPIIMTATGLGSACSQCLRCGCRWPSRCSSRSSSWP